MPRGGKREGAGAPKGNLNALKHGRRSRQFAELGAIIAASPTARETLLKLAERDAARHRTADETAAYIIAEVLRRGIVRGDEKLAQGDPEQPENPRDGLIVIPQTLDGRTINDSLHPTEKNSRNRRPAIKPPTRKVTPNQKLHRTEND